MNILKVFQNRLRRAIANMQHRRREKKIAYCKQTLYKLDPIYRLEQDRRSVARMCMQFRAATSVADYTFKV